MKLPPADWGIPTDGRIPALSFRIPWPWALLRYGKRVENRQAWDSCRYRGPLILHAASWPKGDADRLASKPTVDAEDFADTAQAMITMARKSGADLGEKVTLGMLLAQRGGTFGICNLIGTIAGPMDFEQQVSAGVISESQRAWYMGGFALLLADVRPIPFVACQGAPGLFGINHEAYRQLEFPRATEGGG